MFNFGKMLKELRIKRQLTQKKLANAIHSTERTIQSYEANVKKPSFDALIAISNCLNISLDALTGRVDSPVEAFASRLGSLMCNAPINCQDLADKLEISELNIELYLTSTLEPTTSVLVKLADYFDVSLDYLLGRSEHMDGMTPIGLRARENELLKNLDEHFKGAYNHAKNDLSLSELKGIIEAFEKINTK